MLLHRYSEVLNMPVVCVNNGRSIGTVKDVILNLDSKDVMGILLVHQRLCFGMQVIMLDDINNISTDAVVAESRDNVKKMKKEAYEKTFASNESLIGRRVFSRSGSELGIIRDFIFNSRSGRIEELDISEGVLQDIMSGRKRLPLIGRTEFGEEFAVVDNEAVEEMEESGGGLKNKLLKEN